MATVNPIFLNGNKLVIDALSNTKGIAKQMIRNLIRATSKSIPRDFPIDLDTREVTEGEEVTKVAVSARIGGVFQDIVIYITHPLFMVPAEIFGDDKAAWRTAIRMFNMDHSENYAYELAMGRTHVTDYADRLDAFEAIYQAYAKEARGLSKSDELATSGAPTKKPVKRKSDMTAVKATKLNKTDTAAVEESLAEINSVLKSVKELRGVSNISAGANGLQVKEFHLGLSTLNALRQRSGLKTFPIDHENFKGRTRGVMKSRAEEIMKLCDITITTLSGAVKKAETALEASKLATKRVTASKKAVSKAEPKKIIKVLSHEIPLGDPIYFQTSKSAILALKVATGRRVLISDLKLDIPGEKINRAEVTHVFGPIEEGYAGLIVDIHTNDSKTVRKVEMYVSAA